MKGLTLLETIVAISIAALVFLIAIPSLRQQATQSIDTIAQAQLLQELQYAQRVANAKMISVAVCLSRDGKTCVASDGTMVLTFADSHADGELHEGNQLISSAYLKGKGLLHLRAYPSYRNYVLILPTIIYKTDNGTFWYCAPDHTLQWAITVNQYGEPHLSTKPDTKLEC